MKRILMFLSAVVRLIGLLAMVPGIALTLVGYAFKPK